MIESEQNYYLLIYYTLMLKPLHTLLRHRPLLLEFVLLRQLDRIIFFKVFDEQLLVLVSSFVKLRCHDLILFLNLVRYQLVMDLPQHVT